MMRYSALSYTLKGQYRLPQVVIPLYRGLLRTLYGRVIHRMTTTTDQVVCGD